MLVRAITYLEKVALLAGRVAAVLMLLMLVAAGVSGLLQLLLKYKQYLDNGLLDVLIPVAQAHWVQELPQFLFGWVFMLGVAYTLQQNGHVRIDVLYNRFGQKGRAIIELLGTWLLLVPMCGVFIWLSYDLIVQSVQSQEGATQMGGIPYYFYKLALIPLPILLLVQAMAHALRAIQCLIQPASVARDHDDQAIV